MAAATMSSGVAELAARTLHPNQDPVAKARAKLLFAAPDPAKWCDTGLFGEVWLVRDKALDTCLLQLYDLNTLMIRFEYEVYEDMELAEAPGCPTLCTFEMDDFMAALLFVNAEEAAAFRSAAVDFMPRSADAGTLETLRRQSKQQAGVGSRLKRLFSLGSSSSSSSTARGRSRTRSSASSSNKKASSAPRPTPSPRRRESMCLTWGVDSTVGLNEDGSLDPTDLPQEWKSMLKSAGVRRSDLQDPDTAGQLLDIMGDAGEQPPAASGGAKDGAAAGAGAGLGSFGGGDGDGDGDGNTTMDKRGYDGPNPIDTVVGLVITENPILTMAVVSSVEGELGALAPVPEADDDDDDNAAAATPSPSPKPAVAAAGARAAALGAPARLPPHRRVSMLSTGLASISEDGDDDDDDGGGGGTPAHTPPAARSPVSSIRGSNAAATRIIREVAKDKRASIVAAKGGLMAAIAASKFKQLRPVKVNRRVSVVQVNGVSAAQKDSLMGKLIQTMASRRQALVDPGSGGDGESSDEYWSD